MERRWAEGLEWCGMDRAEEERVLQTAQAQEWARRNVGMYEPRWSRARVFAFWAAVMMACVSCYLAWMELAK